MDARTRRERRITKGQIEEIYEKLGIKNDADRESVLERAKEIQAALETESEPEPRIFFRKYCTSASGAPCDEVEEVEHA